MIRYQYNSFVHLALKMRLNCRTEPVSGQITTTAHMNLNLCDEKSRNQVWNKMKESPYLQYAIHFLLPLFCCIYSWILNFWCFFSHNLRRSKDSVSQAFHVSNDIFWRENFISPTLNWPITSTACSLFISNGTGCNMVHVWTCMISEPNHLRQS